MENLKHYGHENIQNYSLLTQTRLQKEVSVLHKITEGSFQYLTGYDTIRKKLLKKICLKMLLDYIFLMKITLLLKSFFVIYTIYLYNEFPKEYPFRPPC